MRVFRWLGWIVPFAGLWALLKGAWVDMGWWATYTFQDRQGDKTTRRTHCQDTVYADALVAAQTFRGLLEGVTASDIIKMELSQVYVEDAATLPDNTDISQGALITMRINGNPLKSATFVIPAPKPGVPPAGIFTSAQDEGANVVKGDVAPVSLLVQGFTPDGEMFISDDEEVDEVNGFVGGYRVPRKGGRNL